MEQVINIFWFRRDLRINDNTGLAAALGSGKMVLPIFIFDDNITEELPSDDPRISFIYDNLTKINTFLSSCQSALEILKGDPYNVWSALIKKYNISEVYYNRDYEPYALERDFRICKLLETKGIKCREFKDQVIFEKKEIVKPDATPYTVFTPYKNTWLKRYRAEGIKSAALIDKNSFARIESRFPEPGDLGFKQSTIKVKPYKLDVADNYEGTRNYPAIDGTSMLGPHLRFGTVSIRDIIKGLKPGNISFLNELIWREFFMQILFSFPDVVTGNFKRKYDNIRWRNNESEFEAWCKGQTGYPLVDAGMRQLMQTGYMHNRVRMVTAGFLCKHLLIDWRWGEAYFAEKLLDYELSSNNGNWQWAAGTGCDAAPYFRVFNPSEQLKKFDSKLDYVKKWLPELSSQGYPEPIVDHSYARNRAIETYRKALRDI
ncbi:MAG: deoxyribodipyrimidine photo-lyase [Marinilabiliaceae bacterium]|jgi:deoxyribodipyrimidine photo-lyase|nr:deoxyribodipyrimidine photo-lyase [Marinilabiliaceae bacterium]